MLVNSGTWRPVARRYGEWFRSTFTLEEPKQWYYDIDRSGGGPIDHQAMPIDEMPTWDLHHTGMPEYHSWDADHPDGFTIEPTWGTSAQFRAGMDVLHAQGRRMMLYILGTSRSVNSSIYAPDTVDDWAMWVNPNGNYLYLSEDHVIMCWGSPQFQTYLSAGCKTALIETGADGIRLDQGGSAFSPCFNPGHNHVTPFDGNLWRDQMLSKIRAKMDEVNPDAVLYTENLWDAVHRYCDGALPLHTPGFDQPPMALIVPNYRVRSHHAGQAEAALNGWITAGTHAVRQDHGWLWIDEPAFLHPPGPQMKWHLIRPTFIETLKHPDMTGVDPYAPDDAQWIGRVWKADDYWLMVGGHFDASPLNGPTQVKLPDDLPGEIRYACEIDLLGSNTDVGIDDIDPRILFRTGSGSFVTVRRAFSAVLLPRPTCPPLILVEGPLPDLAAGDQNEPINLVPFAPWGGKLNPQVTVTTYAFDVAAAHPHYGPTADLTLPAGAVLSIPADIPLQTRGPALSLYKMTVTGMTDADCLPLELWLEIHN